MVEAIDLEMVLEVSYGHVTYGLRRACGYDQLYFSPTTALLLYTIYHIMDRSLRRGKESPESRDLTCISKVYFAKTLLF